MTLRGERTQPVAPAGVGSPMLGFFSTAAGPLANACGLQPEDSGEAPQESARTRLRSLVPDLRG